MNFWPRYPGDYARKTTRLTLTEHGAYTLLLDEAYSNEEPLPADIDDLCRICRAITKEERKAVEKVAEQFFPIHEDGFRYNDRVDQEIAKATPKLKAARENGAKGGRRPKKKEPTGLPDKKPTGLARAEPTGLPKEEPTGLPNGQALQNQNQKEEILSPRQQGDGDEDPGVEGFSPTPAGAVCRALKQAGIARVNPGHSTLRQLLDAGATTEELVGLVPMALGKGDPFSWLLTAATNQRLKAAEIAKGLYRGPLPTTPKTEAEKLMERGSR